MLQYEKTRQLDFDKGQFLDFFTLIERILETFFPA